MSTHLEPEEDELDDVNFGSQTFLDVHHFNTSVSTTVVQLQEIVLPQPLDVAWRTTIERFEAAAAMIQVCVTC